MPRARKISGRKYQCFKFVFTQYIILVKYNYGIYYSLTSDIVDTYEPSRCRFSISRFYEMYSATAVRARKESR